MHHFDPPPPPKPRHREFVLWGACIAVLVVPALLVWIMRGTALVLSCDPSPVLCHGMALGSGLRDALDLAWFIGLRTWLCVGIAFIASVAMLGARHPVIAALTILLLPLAAAGLPAGAVLTAWNADCMPNEEAVGDCILWGEKLGMTAHNAVAGETAAFAMAPYTFALALMIGVIGFLFFRPHDG